MTTVTIKPGILSLPGATHSSKQTLESLLTEDHSKHHCYFRSIGFHNHLSHHILAAYDLGASAELLKALYAEEVKYQRPIMLDGEGDSKMDGVAKPGKINESNWKEYLGQQTSYAAFVHFFEEQVKKLGAVDAVEKYIFSPEANDNGTEMLVRLVSGALHPFIQLGYAAEFGSHPALVAAALSQTAIHKYGETGLKIFKHDPSSTGNKLPLLQVLAQINASEVVKPVMPYKPEALFGERIQDAFGSESKRGPELARLCSMWDLPESMTPKVLESVVEEAIWTSTLLFAGTSKADKKPRLDFFLMHALTSSLFLRSLCHNLVKNPTSQTRLIRHWFTMIMIVCIARGRPQVDGSVLMGYPDVALPPNFSNVAPEMDGSAIRTPGGEKDGINPWPMMIQSALRAPDSHTIKSLRTLLFGAIHYGTTPAGSVPGSVDKQGKEVMKGLKEVDGTIFVRAAGVLLNTLGWVDWGQPGGDWDRSALGWDEAWNVSDEEGGRMGEAALFGDRNRDRKQNGDAGKGNSKM